MIFYKIFNFQPTLHFTLFISRRSAQAESEGECHSLEALNMERHTENIQFPFVCLEQSKVNFAISPRKR